MNEVKRLLEKIEKLSGDPEVFITFFSDESGSLIVWNEEVLDFENYQDMMNKLKNYQPKL